VLVDFRPTERLRLELALDVRRTASADPDEVATAVGAALHAHRGGAAARVEKESTA
jgi:hypothetical protein